MSEIPRFETFHCRIDYIFQERMTRNAAYECVEEETRNGSTGNYEIVIFSNQVAERPSAKRISIRVNTSMYIERTIAPEICSKGAFP